MEDHQVTRLIIGVIATVLVLTFMMIAFSVRARVAMCKTHFPTEVSECLWSGNYHVRSNQ